MKIFKCGRCDKILEKKYAGNHPKSAITWYNADEHEERKKKVDELQENSNEDEPKKDKVNDIDTLKAKLHDLEERVKNVDDDGLNDLLEAVRAQLEELEKPKKETKEAQRKYDVLGYEQYYSASYSGDELMQARGSVD